MSRIVAALKQQPLALVLCVVLVTMLGLFYQLRSQEAQLQFEQRKLIAELLSKCGAP